MSLSKTLFFPDGAVASMNWKFKHWKSDYSKSFWRKYSKTTTEKVKICAMCYPRGNVSDALDTV